MKVDYQSKKSAKSLQNVKNSLQKVCKKSAKRQKKSAKSALTADFADSRRLLKKSARFCPPMDGPGREEERRRAGRRGKDGPGEGAETGRMEGPGGGAETGREEGRRRAGKRSGDGPGGGAETGREEGCQRRAGGRKHCIAFTNQDAALTSPSCPRPTRAGGPPCARRPLRRRRPCRCARPRRASCEVLLAQR